MLTKLKNWLIGITLLVAIVVGLFFPPLIGVLAYPLMGALCIVYVLHYMGY